MLSTNNNRLTSLDSMKHNNLHYKEHTSRKQEKIITEKRVSTNKNGEEQIFVRKYVKGQCLGKGGFAKCYEIQHKSSGKKFAVKIIDKKTLTKSKTKQKFHKQENI